ncbi:MULTISPECIES: sensor histidine kinase [Streptomyces]|uniref:sensor histidine kinase n=1 Tax=Streptomyces TaxID=1883 RepID=UPI001678D070|nr:MULTISPECIES: sensor histidine kinase [Streptomyces]MBD3577480.1 sensor histidine kinase [Streptomyces sp. KD18]GGT00390.1 two-component sensor histidine kinase [Streptomyces toxytricini]
METSSAGGGGRAARPAWRTAVLWGGAGIATLVLLNLVLRVPLGIGDRIADPAVMLATGSVLGGTLLVRRAPVATLVLMLGSAVAVVFLYDNPGVASAPVLAAAGALGRVAVERSRRVAFTAVGATVLVLILLQLVRPVEAGPAVVLVQGQLPVVVLAWLIGDSVRRSRQAAAQAHAAATEQALTDERLRIARELHDMVAHSIGIIAIQAGVGSRVIDARPDQARDALQAIEATSRDTLASLRRTLVALRRGGPAPLAPTPGLDGLERLAAATAGDTGLRIDVAVSGRRRPLPQDVELAAYRIVQEALTNTVRHARARHCRVDVAYEDGALAIGITDDGRSSPAQDGGSGFGITGMHERAALLGGSLDAGPLPAGGFRVAAVLPLPATTATATARTAPAAEEAR